MLRESMPASESRLRRASATLAGACLLGLCAIPLAPPCGARTPSAGDPVRMHARLEFPTIGDGKPTGLLAADLDGDGKSEIIGITTGPPAVQVWSGLDASP